MFYFMKSCDRLNAGITGDLHFVGFGIRHPRRGEEQIIPNLYNDTEHYSLVFNHEPVSVRIDGEKRAFPGNTLVLWDRSHRVVYGDAGQRWRLSWLQLHGEEFDKLLRTHHSPRNRPFSFNSERIINNYWLPISEEFSEYIRLDLPLVLNHINGILLEIDRLIRNAGNSEIRIPESFRQIRSYLDNNYTENITLTALSERIHLAPAYFCRKFKEYFGQAPIDYAVSLRLHDAALCLHNPDLSIREVAEQAGYKDSFHFSKLFKRHFGIAPQGFRNRLLKKQG